MDLRACQFERAEEVHPALEGAVDHRRDDCGAKENPGRPRASQKDSAHRVGAGEER
jgi:hypothetical protein